MSEDKHNAARGRAWAIFFTCLLGFNLSMFYRVSVTVISPELSRDLDLTASQLGDLSAAFFYGFAFCQLPLGMALDRLGARKVMPLINLVGVAGAVLFAMASSPGMAVTARAMIGVGMSCNLMGPLLPVRRLVPAGPLRHHRRALHVPGRGGPAHRHHPSGVHVPGHGLAGGLLGGGRGGPDAGGRPGGDFARAASGK